MSKWVHFAIKRDGVYLIYDGGYSVTVAPGIAFSGATFAFNGKIQIGFNPEEAIQGMSGKMKQFKYL